MLKKVLFLIVVVLFSAWTSFSASRFSLIESRSKAISGPYTIYQGAKVRIGGDLYELSLPDDRISFIATDGKVYGPFEPVEGRMMRINNATYTFTSQSVSLSQPIAPEVSVAPEAPAVQQKPIVEFRPIPPKKEMIPISEDATRRTVDPLDLPSLPDASHPFMWGLWYSPIDITPFKWSVDSFSGAESDLERSTLGIGLYYNSWMLEAQYSISAEGGNVVPNGMGITESSLDDGNSKSIAVGYKRPFLDEGRWKALAGVYFRYRLDEVDMSVRSLSQGTVIGTNNVESYFSSYSTKESSIEVEELLLRVDLELAYSQERWGASAAALIYALSDVAVSGKFPYSGGSLELSAKHDNPVGMRISGWYQFNNDGWRARTELTLGPETELRLGITRSF